MLTLTPADTSRATKPRPPSRIELFRRLHIQSMWQRKGATALVVFGIALGVSVLLAIATLVAALGRPFSSIADAVAGQADIQATPLVHDRLPEDALRTVRSTRGVRLAVPVVGGLSTLRSERASHGALLLGSDCVVERMLGDFGCSERLATLASGSGVPLAISAALARDLHVGLGDTLAAPGGRIGEAHVGAILNEPRLARLNGGRYALGLVPDIQHLTASGPHLSSILIRSDQSPATRQNLASSLAGLATISSPGARLRMFLSLTRALLLFFAVLVLVAGAMIAATTYTLSLDDRRKSLAVAEVLGSSPSRTVVSLLLEGVLLGALGAVAAIAPGYLLGSWFTERFGNAILRGTGASLTSPAALWMPAFALAAGIVAGAGAALFPAIRLVREGSLVAVREQAGILPAYTAPRWPAIFALLIPLGMPLTWAYGNGYVPLAAGLAGFFLAILGLLGAFFGLTPVLVSLLQRAMRVAGAPGLLAGADLTRDPLRLAAVVTTIGIAVSTAIGLSCVTRLAADSIARNVASEIGGNIYVSPRDMGDQADFRFNDSVLGRLRDLPGVARVVPQTLAVVDWGQQGLNISGTDTHFTRNNLTFVDIAPRTAWARVRRGEIIVSWVLANRQGIGAGDHLTLPTLHGPVPFRVAAVAKPGFAFDNGIGDLVVGSYELTDKYWHPGIEVIIVTPTPGTSPTRLAQHIRAVSDVRMYPLDRASTPPQAAASVRRFFAPVGIVGYTLVPIAALAITNFLLLGLLQKRRLRAMLRFVGYRPSVERRTLLYEALVMGLLGAAFGTIGAIVVSFVTTLVSPALLAATVPWRLLPENLALGILTALAACLTAILPPSVEAGNLNILSAITSE